jgi:hypothetical protein
MTHTLQPLLRHCPTCGETMGAASHPYRTSTPWDTVLHRTLQRRRCRTTGCPHWHRPSRPEAEGRLARPKHACGLDVLAWVGTLRSAQHRSLPAMHQHLRHRGVVVAPRTVPHLLARYAELVRLSLTDPGRLQRITQARGRVLLAMAGVQPDVGHAVLWVWRDC